MHLEVLLSAGVSSILLLLLLADGVNSVSPFASGHFLLSCHGLLQTEHFLADFMMQSRLLCPDIPQFVHAVVEVPLGSTCISLHPMAPPLVTVAGISC